MPYCEYPSVGFCVAVWHEVRLSGTKVRLATCFVNAGKKLQMQLFLNNCLTEMYNFMSILMLPFNVVYPLKMILSERNTLVV
jgi:hypothetical protein